MSRAGAAVHAARRRIHVAADGACVEREWQLFRQLDESMHEQLHVAVARGEDAGRQLRSDHRRLAESLRRQARGPVRVSPRASDARVFVLCSGVQHGGHGVRAADRIPGRSTADAARLPVSDSRRRHRLRRSARPVHTARGRWRREQRRAGRRHRAADAHSGSVPARAAVGRASRDRGDLAGIVRAGGRRRYQRRRLRRRHRQGCRQRARRGRCAESDRLLAWPGVQPRAEGHSRGRRRAAEIRRQHTGLPGRSGLLRQSRRLHVLLCQLLLVHLRRRPRDQQ